MTLENPGRSSVARRNGFITNALQRVRHLPGACVQAFSALRLRADTSTCRTRSAVLRDTMSNGMTLNATRGARPDSDEGQSRAGILNRVFLRQDLRDTEGFWFYWYFRVRGASGRTLTFHFTDGKPVGVRGPAISLDEGATWTWLGADCCRPTDNAPHRPSDSAPP